jgi:ABC-type enterochelin transport system substrate-binding protein
MNKLKEYNSIEDSIETLYSIYIYKKKVKEVINYFENELENAKKINNIIKKNKINNRLFIFF